MDVNWKHGAILGAVVCSYIILINMSWSSLFIVSVLCVTAPRFLAAAFTDGDLTLFLAEKFGYGIDTLKGQVVWITGASSGIGESLSVCLASHGVKLVLSARREVELERVKKQCLLSRKCTESNVMVLPMDVQEEDKHSEHLQAILDRFGQLDILVNNAGRWQKAMWEDIDPEVDQQLFRLNVFSVVSLSRVVLKYFLGRDGGPKGHIAVTSSMAGRIHFPFSSVYAGSKHALHGYFECLRVEKGSSGINVTLLCPGGVATSNMAEGFTAKPNEKYGQNSDDEAVPFRLTSERCGYLCAVALANCLSEAWILKRPLLLIIYIYNFLPNFIHSMMWTMGPKFAHQFRNQKSKADQNKH